MAEQQLEFWLRGPVEGIEPVLQPVAHAILQAQLEVQEALMQFPDSLLWQKPGNVASVGFHLQHLTGVLDRLFTYARGERLSDWQRDYLEREGKDDGRIGVAGLLGAFNSQVEKSILELKNTLASSVFEKREVGRKKIPSSVMGLLFHAAEHTQRHTGQLLVTARILVNA